MISSSPSQRSKRLNSQTRARQVGLLVRVPDAQRLAAVLPERRARAEVVVVDARVVRRGAVGGLDLHGRGVVGLVGEVAVVDPVLGPADVHVVVGRAAHDCALRDAAVGAGHDQRVGALLAGDLEVLQVEARDDQVLAGDLERRLAGEDDLAGGLARNVIGWSAVPAASSVICWSVQTPSARTTVSPGLRLGVRRAISAAEPAACSAPPPPPRAGRRQCRGDADGQCQCERQTSSGE